MQSRPKSFYVALAPIILLIVMIVGMRLLRYAVDSDPAMTHTADAAMQPTGPPLTPVDPTPLASIESVVMNQSIAIRRHDFEDALRYSVPEFRQNVTPKQFAGIIGSNYKAFTDFKSIKFTHAVGNSQRAVIGATFTSTSGTEADYTVGFTHTDGGWLVRSCMPEPRHHRLDSYFPGQSRPRAPAAK